MRVRAWVGLVVAFASVLSACSGSERPDAAATGFCQSYNDAFLSFEATRGAAGSGGSPRKRLAATAAAQERRFRSLLDGPVPAPVRPDVRAIHDYTRDLVRQGGIPTAAQDRGSQRHLGHLYAWLRTHCDASGMDDPAVGPNPNVSN